MRHKAEWGVERHVERTAVWCGSAPLVWLSQHYFTWSTGIIVFDRELTLSVHSATASWVYLLEARSVHSCGTGLTLTRTTSLTVMIVVKTRIPSENTLHIRIIFTICKNRMLRTGSVICLEMKFWCDIMFSYFSMTHLNRTWEESRMKFKNFSRKELLVVVAAPSLVALAILTKNTDRKRIWNFICKCLVELVVESKVSCLPTRCFLFECITCVQFEQNRYCQL